MKFESVAGGIKNSQNDTIKNLSLCWQRGGKEKGAISNVLPLSMKFVECKAKRA